MTGFNHGLTGAVIALAIKQPALAIPLAFASHFVQDIMPHWDYSVRRDKGKTANFFNSRFIKLLAADFTFSICLMIVLGIMFPSEKWRIWLCMVAAASPDLMWAYYRLYLQKIKDRKPKLDPLAKMHAAIQWSQTARGLWVEAAWFCAAWFIILLYK